MTELWCELAWLGGEAAQPGVSLRVEEGRFAAVEPGVERPPAGAERLGGLTLPGLANAHSHAFQRALRGRTHAGRRDFWAWRDGMYALAERLDPELFLRLARAAYAEMALAGITCVGEFHYLHHGPGGVPYANPNELGEAAIAAAAEAGIRITLLDACYLSGGFGSELAGTQLRFADASAAAWAERAGRLAPAAHARIGAAIHSVRAVDPAGAAAVADWARERGAPLHAHVSEQPAENERCLAAYGLTPAAVLDRAGALGERFTAVHATHLADADVGLLGSRSVTCCICPTTERDLADGVAPARRLRDAGASLALGTDSHAIVDPFEEARAVELDQRLVTGERGHHSPAELLEAASAAGHRCLGWPEAGRIEPGALADLVTLGLDSARLAGSDPASAPAAAVFAASAADVRSVMVGGEWVVRDGRHARLDAAGELEAAVREAWA